MPRLEALLKNRIDYEIVLASALRAEFGVKAYAEDGDRLRRNLYVARRELAEEEGIDLYAGLSISISPNDENVIFVYKRDWKERLECLEEPKKNDL